MRCREEERFGVLPGGGLKLVMGCTDACGWVKKRGVGNERCPGSAFGGRARETSRTLRVGYSYTPSGLVESLALALSHLPLELM